MNCNYKSVCTTSPNYIYCSFDGYICDEKCTEHIDAYIERRDEVLYNMLHDIDTELDEIDAKLKENGYIQ